MLLFKGNLSPRQFIVEHQHLFLPKKTCFLFIDGERSKRLLLDGRVVNSYWILAILLILDILNVRSIMIFANCHEIYKYLGAWQCPSQVRFGRGCVHCQTTLYRKKFESFWCLSNFSLETSTWLDFFFSILVHKLN